MSAGEMHLKPVEEFEIVSTADGVDTFVCIFCRKQFLGKTQAKRHVTMTHKKRPFDCTNCTAQFRQYSDLLNHIQGHRQPKAEPERDDSKPLEAKQSKEHRCQICPSVFRSRTSLRDHMDKHAGIAPKRETLACGKCDAVFQSREGRRVHMILKHAEGVTYRCAECPMIFARKGNLRLHMTTHGLRPHVCSVCGKSYARIESLKLHEESCASGVPKGLACGECGQRFRKPELLEKHREQGHPEKDHQCGHCGQGFETKRALSHHVRVHEGKFRCDHCSLQFVTEKALRNHEQTRHWEVLGLERVVGRQGRRKDAVDRPKEPKVRVRRNKHNPFIGLEHLLEKDGDVSGGKKATMAVEPVKSTHRTTELVILCEKIKLPEEASSDVESLHNITINEEEIKSEPSDKEDNDVFGMDSPNADSDTASERDIFEDIDDEKETSEVNVDQKLSKPKRKPNPAWRRKSNAKNPQRPNFPCKTCGRTFVYLYHLKTHQAKEHGVGNVPMPKRIRAHFCKHCEKYFAGWKGLVDHLTKIHGEKVDETQFVRCSSCLHKFVSAEDMEGHSCLKGSYVGRERKFECNLCDKTYLSAHGLESHRSAHPEYHVVSCDECQKPFASEKELQHHKKRIHVKPSYVCEVCNKAFKRLPQLRVHAQIHLEQKGYCCEYCGKSFAQRNGLTAHLQIYHAEQLGEEAVAEREITCEVCAKKLKGKRCYKLHMKVHNSEERKFPCNFCSMKFITKQDLVRHEQRHTKEYAYSCRFCGKGSTRRHQIALHEARVHNWPAPLDLALLHKCAECGRGFGSKSALKMHETLHVEGLPVPCKLCDKRFKNVKYMTYHMKMHHADGSPTMKPRKKRQAKTKEVREQVQEDGDFKAIEIHENPLFPMEEEVGDGGGEAANGNGNVVYSAVEVKSESS